MPMRNQPIAHFLNLRWFASSRRENPDLKAFRHPLQHAIAHRFNGRPDVVLITFVKCQRAVQIDSYPAH